MATIHLESECPASMRLITFARPQSLTENLPFWKEVRRCFAFSLERNNKCHGRSKTSFILSRVEMMALPRWSWSLGQMHRQIQIMRQTKLNWHYTVELLFNSTNYTMVFCARRAHYHQTPDAESRCPSSSSFLLKVHFVELQRRFAHIFPSKLANELRRSSQINKGCGSQLECRVLHLKMRFP